MPVSPNVEGFHGLMQLRDRFGEISEEACLTLYFNFFQFFQFPLQVPLLIAQTISAPHFGKSSWEEKIKDHGRVLSNDTILGCDVWHKINGTSLCGNGVARRGWEAGRAWSTGNHTVTEVHCQRLRKRYMCGFSYWYWFFPRKWPLALKRRLNFSW